VGAPEAKGAGFVSSMETIRSMVEPAVWDAFVAELPAPTRALVHKPPLPSEWVPLDATVPLYIHAHERLFKRDESRMFEVGRQVLKRDLKTIYRVFIRIASPGYVAARAARIYDTYARDSGRMSVPVEQPQHIEVLVEGHPFPSLPFWAFMRGSVAGVLELTGVKNLQVTLIDGGGLRDHARFRATWS
jgi:hypothetical protein